MKRSRYICCTVALHLTYWRALNPVLFNVWWAETVLIASVDLNRIYTLLTGLFRENELETIFGLLPFTWDPFLTMSAQVTPFFADVVDITALPSFFFTVALSFRSQFPTYDSMIQEPPSNGVSHLSHVLNIQTRILRTDAYAYCILLEYMIRVFICELRTMHWHDQLWTQISVSGAEEATGFWYMFATAASLRLAVVVPPTCGSICGFPTITYTRRHVLPPSEKKSPTENFT